MEQAYCEALKTAIEFELNGLAFYRQLIDRVSDPFAKRVLVFLAGEEVGHIRKIEAFNNFLLGKGDFDMEEECNLDLPDKIQALVQEKMKEAKKNVTPESDDLDIYDVAMLLESKSRELYEQALDENKDESITTCYLLPKDTSKTLRIILKNTAVGFLVSFAWKLANLRL